MTEFRVGQRVKVSAVFEGELRCINGDGTVDVLPDSQAGEYLGRDVEYSIQSEFVTLADPENWPPQLGDIWAVGDKEWFARYSALTPVYLEAADPYQKCYAEYSFDQFKALNPVLVRRK
jgi:hypothetical protein